MRNATGDRGQRKLVLGTGKEFTIDLNANMEFIDHN